MTQAPDPSFPISMSATLRARGPKYDLWPSPHALKPPATARYVRPSTRLRKTAARQPTLEAGKRPPRNELMTRLGCLSASLSDVSLLSCVCTRRTSQFLELSL